MEDASPTLSPCKMTTFKLFAVVCALLFAITSLHGEDKIKCRVQLKVSASETLTDETTSYLTRELRRIDDIDVVNDDPWYVVNVVALETSNNAGTSTGYVFSIVVESPLHPKSLRDLLATKVDENALKIFDFALRTATHIESHFLQVGPTGELESICKKIVAKIDGSVLEDSRKVQQQIYDLTKKDHASPPKP